MWEIFWIVLITVVATDQIVKLIVIKNRIPYFINKWGPLGLYKKHPILRPILWFVQMMILIPLFFSSNLFLFIGAGLISAQLSNLLDHITRGRAVDFISLPIQHPNKKSPIIVNFC